MMDFNSILKAVNKTFKPRKTVNFEGLDIDIEILEGSEEMKVVESIKDFEGAEYVESMKRHTLAFAIKRVNDLNLDQDIIPFEEDGKLVKKSKYLFMRDFLAKWPTALVDLIFDAYTNMQLEVETKLRDTMKFDRFKATEAPEVKEPEPTMKEIKEDEELDENLTDAEKLAKQVEKEQAQAEDDLARSASSAQQRIGL